MTEETRNMILAGVLSLLVLFAWTHFYAEPLAKRQQAAQAAQAARAARSVTAAIPPGSLPTPIGDPTVAVDGSIRPRTLALGGGMRVVIDTPSLHGSINLIGARLDDLTLRRYRMSLQKESPLVDLLSPVGTVEPYFAQIGWLAAGTNIAGTLPDAATQWQASASRLTPESPVRLSWTNTQGVTFQLDYAIDSKFLFTVTAQVINRSGQPISVAPYGLISRRHPAHDETSFAGPLGTFDHFEEISYKSLKDEDKIAKRTATGGWLGFADKYWLTALIPDANLSVTSTIKNISPDDVPIHEAKYQVDMLMPVQTVASGATSTSTMHLFAGAKEVDIIDGYQKTLHIRQFFHAVDWGTFWYLTKPFFTVLDFFYKYFGNFGFAIIGLTVVVRAALFPIANNQFKSMARMKVLQPKIKELQERFKGEPQKLQQAQVELFRTEKINPLAGCLPIFLQIPVFLALYKVLSVTIDMRHQPFVGWIKDLSAPDPLTPVNLFGLLPFTPPAAIAIGILPILYGLTTWIQMRLQPQTMTMDPVQQKMFQYFPLIFMFFFASLPSGLVFYYIVSNILSIGQQQLITRLDNARNSLPVQVGKG